MSNRNAFRPHSKTKLACIITWVYTLINEIHDVIPLRAKTTKSNQVMLLEAVHQLYDALLASVKEALLWLIQSLRACAVLTSTSASRLSCSVNAVALDAADILETKAFKHIDATPVKCASASNLEERITPAKALLINDMIPLTDDHMAFYHPKEVRLNMDVDLNILVEDDSTLYNTHESKPGISAEQAQYFIANTVQVEEARSAFALENQNRTVVSCPCAHTVNQMYGERHHAEGDYWADAQAQYMRKRICELREVNARAVAEIYELRERCAAFEESHRNAASEVKQLIEERAKMKKELSAVSEQKRTLEEKSRALQRNQDCKIAEHERLVVEVAENNKEIFTLQSQMIEAKDIYEIATKIMIGEMKDVLKLQRNIEKEHDIVKKRAEAAEFSVAKHAASVKITAGTITENKKSVRALKRNIN